MDFQSLIQSLTQLPQTQKDIQSLARTGEQIRSPETQAILSAVQTDLTHFVSIQVGLQALSTLAALGVFMITLANYRKAK
jgi:hypothetical protein